jgi:urease accessory protein UreE
MHEKLGAYLAIRLSRPVLTDDDSDVKKKKKKTMRLRHLSKECQTIRHLLSDKLTRIACHLLSGQRSSAA